MYADGYGVPQDDTAAAWFRRAAEQGVARAQYGFGLMYGGRRAREWGGARPRNR